jgi:hypothetical protein
MSKLLEKFSALKRENQALQNNPDPETDPGTPLNPDQIRIHSTDSNGINRLR